MQLFLASSLDQVKELFIEKIWNINWRRIWFISNPADIDREWDIEPRWVKSDREMLESLWWIISHINLKNIKNDELFSAISDCDILYVSWWNTRYFKILADESWFQKIIDELIIKKWMTYISTSAGSCIMWTSIKYMDPDDFKIEQWYGLVNAMILPHWWNDSFKDEYNETVMPKIYNDAQNIITLTDNQVIYMDNNWITILWK